MHRVEPIYDDIRAAVGTLNTRLENNRGGIHLIKSMTAETSESAHVSDASYAYFEANWDRIKLATVYHSGSSLVTNAPFVATFLVGGYWVVVESGLRWSSLTSKNEIEFDCPE